MSFNVIFSTILTLNVCLKIVFVVYVVINSYQMSLLFANTLSISKLWAQTVIYFSKSQIYFIKKYFITLVHTFTL